jgi:hypothetical protein
MLATGAQILPMKSVFHTLPMYNSSVNFEMPANFNIQILDTAPGRKLLNIEKEVVRGKQELYFEVTVNRDGISYNPEFMTEPISFHISTTFQLISSC